MRSKKTSRLGLLFPSVTLNNIKPLAEAVAMEESPDD